MKESKNSKTKYYPVRIPVNAYSTPFWWLWKPYVLILTSAVHCWAFYGIDDDFGIEAIYWPCSGDRVVVTVLKKNWTLVGLKVHLFRHKKLASTRAE